MHDARAYANKTTPGNKRLWKDFQLSRIYFVLLGKSFRCNPKRNHFHQHDEKNIAFGIAL